MDKRYQVFVSSTYADLTEERQKVIHALLELNCIPAGMELFPAIDEEQFQFIRRVIDDCDYYLLIIGGRYGSTTPEGISYTEKEYDYAIHIGLKVIALIHEKPGEIAFEKSEQEPIGQQRLKQFRQKVSTGRLVKYWKSPDELQGMVTLSLVRTMNQFPAIGWVRANKAASVELLTEINEVRKENEKLKSAAGEPGTQIENLAGLDDEMELSGDYRETWQRNTTRHWRATATWREIFGWISPYLVSHPTSESVKSILCANAFKKCQHDGDYESLDDQIFQTVGIQLKALALVKITYQLSTTGVMALFWSLTPRGARMMDEVRTVKKATQVTKTEIGDGKK